MSHKTLSPSSIEALQAIVQYARSKFPQNQKMTAALVEAVGELSSAFLEGSLEQVRSKALDVACVAMRIYEEGDATHDMYFEHLEDEHESLTPAQKKAQYGSLPYQWECCKSPRCRGARVGVGFSAPDDLWEAVMGDQPENVVCYSCFDMRAQAKDIRYDVGTIDFWPVSWNANLS